MERESSLPFAHCVNKFIQHYPDLEYDGARINCNVCETSLAGWNSTDCKKHVQSKTHIRNAKLEFPYETFLFDLIFVFHVCNIPLNVLNTEHLRLFWAKYVPKWPLPKKQAVHWRIPRVKEQIENYIRTDLHDQKVLITVDEATDIKKNKVGNVLVRILTPHEALKPYLIASKRLEKTTPEAIRQLIIEAIDKFGINKKDVLLLVTDGAAYMTKAASLLQIVFPNLLHITCLLHAFRHVEETIRQSYPDIDQLIAITPKAFLKSQLCSKNFHRLCPNIPDLPQLMLTRWGTWLEAAFYYNQYFDDIKSLILTFNSNESSAIGKSQQLFQKLHIQGDLQAIQNNFGILVNGIQELQNTSLSLDQAFQIIDGVSANLQNLTDGPGVRAANKFVDLLNKNPDLEEVRRIKQCISVLNCENEPMNIYFKYASITSLDVECSFSEYKTLFTDKRTHLKESTVEGILMMQVYSQSQLSLWKP